MRLRVSGQRPVFSLKGESTHPLTILTCAMLSLFSAQVCAAAPPTAEGSEFLLATRTVGSQEALAVDMNDDGYFVAVWQSPVTGAGIDIMAHLYDDTGTSVTGERRITSSTSDETLPSVAIDDDGNYVIVWVAPDADGTGIYAAVYDNTGSVLVSAFQVNTGWSYDQSNPAVAMEPDGDFVVVWETRNSDFSYDIAGRSFLADGTPQDANQFMVNATLGDGNQYRPEVGMADDASYVITWYGGGTGDSSGVFARQYAWPSTAQGSPFLVNTTTTDSQQFADVGVSATGSFVVTWSSDNQDGDDRGVYAQRFSNLGAALGTEFLVNTTTSGIQDLSRVSMNAAGDFVVAWESDGQDGSGYGIYLQAYTKLGEPMGAEKRVNTTTSSNQWVPDVACSGTDPFVVVWQSSTQDGSGEGVYGQRYAAQPPAATSEYQVNTYTSGSQNSAAAAMSASGDHVLVYQSNGLDGSGDGIGAQRYAADGTAQGSEITVNTVTAYDQESPAVAMDADGDFVVVWYGWNTGLTDQDVFCQRFNSSGVAQGSEFTVNTYTTSTQRAPAVATDGDGNFVAVWQSSGQDGDNWGIFGQRYASDGTPQGAEFQINTYTTSYQANPRVAMTPTGEFVVVWQSYGQDSSNTGVYGQRYASDGAPQGTEFQVNVQTTGSQGMPDVAVDADGNFVVVYSQYNNSSDSEIDMRRYSSDGTPLTGDVQVNVYNAGHQNYGRVAMDADGDFVVTWQSQYQDGDGYGIYARRYTRDGIVHGGEFQVNEYTTDGQWMPAAAMDAYSNFVIGWYGSTGRDGDHYGVYARLYRPNPNLLSDADLTAPTATVTASTSSPTNSSTVSFAVQFDEDVQNFGAESDLTITETGTVAHTGVTITPTDAQNYTVDVTGASGDGDLTMAVSTSSDVEDLAGNGLASSTSDTVTLDNTGPTAPIVTGTTPTNDTTPTWSWTAGGGGNGTFRWQVDNQTKAWTETTSTSATAGTPLSQGAHTVYVQERDAVGNWSSSGSFEFTVDTTPPTAPSVAGTTPTNDTTPTWSWTAGGGGNGTFRWQMDSEAGSWTETTATSYTPGSALSEATHTLYVQERDAAGNWSSSGAFVVTIDTTPPTPPSVAGAAATNDTTPTFSWTAGGGGSGTFRWQVDNETKAWTTTTSTSCTVGAPLSEGSHTLYVQESDDADNWSSSGSHGFTVDVTEPSAPTVTGEALTNDTTPTWSWTAGGGGNGTFRWQMDSEAGSWTQTTGNSYTPGSAVSEAAHTLYVQERDDAGNWSSSGSKSTTVDATPPGVSISAPSDASTSSGPVSYTITYTGATAITLTEGDVTVNATGAAAATTVAVTGSGTASRTVTLSDITGDGTLSISIAAGTAEDEAGNSAGASGPSAEVTVSEEAPGVPVAAWPALLLLLAAGFACLRRGPQVRG